MYEYNAKVLRVVDGDTIEILLDLGCDIFHNLTVRMYGINAPESRTKDKQEKALGLAAKARLVELIEGKDVVVRTFKDKNEKFGRLLATVLLDGKDVNSLMLEEGLAVAYFGDKR